jgi:outer membrane protein TolC
MKTWLSVVMTLIVLAGCSKDLQGTQSFDPAAEPAAQPVAARSNLNGSVVRTEFAELVRRSVATSPTTAAGTANVLASQFRIEAERGAFRPQLNAETSLTSDGDTVPILRLSQIIYDGGKVSSRVGLRQIEARQTWLSELSELSAQIFEAIEAIIDLDRNRRLEVQARQNLERTEALVSDLQSRFDAGAGSVADLLAGQGRQSNAETELAQVETNVELATATWIEVFGSRPSAIPTIPPAPVLAGTTSQAMVERSPRLRTQVAVSEVRQQEVVVAERATRPTLSAILETDFNEGSIDNGAQARLGVNVPIYQGGSARANVETARANLQQSEADAEELRRELQRSLSQALEETNSIQRRLATARRAVEINEQALDAARGQFDIGSSTIVQILDAIRELNLAQVRVIQLEAQARRAEYAVLAVTGDILDALGVAQPTDPTL